MTCIHELAIVFADLWAVDHHRMVDEIYAPIIHMESMCRLDHPPVETGDDLHALEDRLSAMIPAHRHELVRVTARGTRACLETTVVSPTTGEYAPACVWWSVDERGQVDHEVGFFDWDRRSTDAALAHGWIPPHDARAVAVDALLDAIESGTLAGHLAPGCIVEDVGLGLGTLPGPMVVREHVASGAVLAALVTGGADGRVWRATIVVTGDGSGRIISVRLYSDGWIGVDVEAVHERMQLELRQTSTMTSSPVRP
jgi:hypothetical protein